MNSIRDFLLKDIIIYLLNKLFILEKEVYNLKWSLEYVISIEEQNENKESQFYKDCLFLRNSIDNNDINNNKDSNELSLLAKINEIKKVLLDNEYLNSLSIYELILLLDCIHQRINTTLLQKFEYLHRAYENLVLSYNTLYMPNPSISKLAKTSNLMLYFNNRLNEISGKLQKIINNKINKKEVFSTWNFISADHISNHDSKDFIPLEFSFWLYEIPIFHSIAIHEIYHKYYFDDERLKFNLSEDLEFFSKEISEPIKNKLNISNDFIISLYQEILSDLHAFMFAKENYIYVLFLTGFAFKLYNKFYKKLNINENITHEERCCKNRHNNHSIFGMQFTADEIAFIIRIRFLLDFIERFSEENIQSREKIKEIKKIIDFIMPSSLKQDTKILNDFDNLLSNFVQYNDYRQYKTGIEFIFITFKQFFEKKNIYSELEKRYRIINSENENCNFIMQELFSRYINLVNNLDKLILKFNNKEESIANINYILQEKFRKLNIEKLLQNLSKSKEKEFNYSFSYEESDNEINTSLIYYLTFIKLSKMEQKEVLNLFLTGRFNNFKYSFGPFDLVQLVEKKHSFLKNLEKQFEENKFFIDNHSLILINTINPEIKQIEDNKKIFDIIFSIDVKNAFAEEKNEEKVYLEIIKILESYIKKRYYCEIYFSMGNENIVVFIYNIEFDNIENIIDKFHRLNNITNISSTILLNENVKNDKSCHLELENIVILLKLRTGTLSDNYIQLKQKITVLNELWKEKYPKKGDEKNIRVFKKLGVYDAKIIISKINIKDLETLITEISNLTLDIQVEKEIKVE